MASDILPSNEDNLFDPSRWKSLEQTDFWFHNMGTFVCIWKAPEPYEFIIADNTFGIWEGNCGPGMWSQAYHHFYPVSPRRIIVLSKISYKNNDIRGIGTAKFDTLLGLSTADSLFPERIHNFPLVQYPGKPAGVGLYQTGTKSCRLYFLRYWHFGEEDGTPFDLKNLTEKQRQDANKARRDAKYTYTVSRLTKEHVLLANAIFLNELHESVTFRSHACLLKSIRAYKKHRNLFRQELLPPGAEKLVERYDFSEKGGLEKGMTILLPLMKRDLKELEKASWNELNRTHQESLGKRRTMDHSRDKREWQWVISEQKENNSQRRLHSK